MAFMMLEWVFTSIFLILVVLALRAALGKRMSAGLRYALWAVVLVRLLVPVQLFTSPIAGTWVAAEQRTEHQITDWPAVSAAPVNAPGDSALGLPVKDAASENVPAPPVLPDAPTVPDAPEPPDLSNPPWQVWAGCGWPGRRRWLLCSWCRICGFSGSCGGSVSRWTARTNPFGCIWRWGCPPRACSG